MSEDTSPMRVEAKIDGTEALNKTVENTSIGLSRVFSVCLAKREADNAAYTIRALEQANTDKELIACGAAVFDPKTGAVDRLFPPEQIARLLLALRQADAPKNVAACFQFSAVALEKSGQEESQDHMIDPDFLDAWLDGAQKVNSEYLQSVWGKILALNIRQENAISIRTVLSLAQVSQQEAELFTHFLEYRLDNMIVLPTQFLNEEVFGLTFGDVLILTDAGFLIPEKWVAQLCRDEESPTIHTFMGNNAIVKIKTEALPRFALSGRALSIMGQEVARIAEPAEITEDALRYFYEILSKKYPGKIKGIYAHKIIGRLENGKIEYNDVPFLSYTPSEG